MQSTPRPSTRNRIPLRLADLDVDLDQVPDHHPTPLARLDTYLDAIDLDLDK